MTQSVLRWPYQFPKEVRGTRFTNPQVATPSNSSVIPMVTLRQRTRGARLRT